MNADPAGDRTMASEGWNYGDILDAIEAVEYGVRINAVSPSIARHKFLEKTSSAELLDRLSEGEAFGRAYDLPNMSAYCETCASIANAMVEM